MTAILSLASALLLSTGLDFFVNLRGAFPLQTVQSYAGFTLIGFSVILAILNPLLTRHPFYEYWLTALIGSVVGVIYVG